MGCGVSVAATALGATVIEKHFTLRRADGGVDSSFSVEPLELRQLREETERAWQALGDRPGRVVVQARLPVERGKHAAARVLRGVTTEMLPFAAPPSVGARVAGASGLTVSARSALNPGLR